MHLSRVKKWEKVGSQTILAKGHGKRLVKRLFINPVNGQIVDHTIFDSDAISAVILPLTADLEVIAIRQFRHGVGEIIIELPGGNADLKNESIIEAAKRELLEETGYQADELIQLPGKLWIDPGTCTPCLYPFLALKCKKISDPQNNENEPMETMTIPIRQWLDMIASGKISDMKTVALTAVGSCFLEKRSKENG
jgi:ADP-ribose pyrophosphatase